MLTELRATLASILAELPAAELPAFIGVLAEAQAQATAMLVAPVPAEPVGLVDAGEMARLLGVPANWVRDKARAGALPCVQLGHYVRFDVPETLAAARRVSKVHDARLCRPEIPPRNRGPKSAGVPVVERRGAA